MKPKTIVVLGGAGFVGRHLCRRLAEGGHRVRVLTRRAVRHRELTVVPTIELVELDVHDPLDLAAALRDASAAVNLVGILNPSGTNTFRAVHVDLPAKLVQACRQAGVARLLHMCALQASPEAPSEYLRSKAEGERRVLEAESDKLHVTSFRPALIFGPQGGFVDRFAGLLRQIPFLFPLACAESRHQPVFVGDVVRAMVAALDRQETHGRSYGLCGPDVLTLRQIVTRIARHHHLRRKILSLGPGLSRLQASLLQWAPGQPFTPDNFRSLQVASTCDSPFPPWAGASTLSLDAFLRTTPGSISGP